MVVTLDRLAQQIGTCKQCQIGKDQSMRISGKGGSQLEVIIVGETPGGIKQSDPFAKKVYSVLTEIFVHLGMSEDKVWLTNILKCPTPDHRDPLDTEIRTCQRFLKEEIRAIDPKLIIAMGRAPAYFFTGIRKPVEDLRGKVRRYRGWPVIITYHPSAVKRFPFLKARLLQDLDLAKEIDKIKKAEPLAFMKGRLVDALDRPR